MRRTALLLAASMTLAAACSSTSETSAPAGGSSTSTETSAPSTSAGTTPGTTAGADGAGGTTPPNSMDVTLDTTPGDDGSAPAASDGTIIMLKLQVGDSEAAKTFYGTVFGAQPVGDIGGGATIMTFPNGGPGLILLGSGGEDGDRKGAFIFRVADLAATKALALENGATEQGTFTGDPGGQSARSVDLLDPWGNQIEILQLG